MHYRNNTRRQSGFTLIELLITVAIIAILAVMGATAYASFGAKAQVAEGFSQVEGVKHAYMVRYNEDGKVRGDYQLNELDSSWARENFGGKYVEYVNLGSGQVVIQFRTDADAPLAGTRFTMTPYETAAGAIVWHCGNAPIPNNGAATPAPLSLAGTTGGAPAVAATSTTTPASLLPKDCRA